MADITLPQLGETVTEGTILRWFKKIGDSVAADEPLFEISTDKVDTEVPSPIAGTLMEIRANEGDTIAVGTIVAVVGAGGAATIVAPAVEAPAPVTQAPVAQAPAVEAPAVEAPAPVAESPVLEAPSPAPAVTAPASESGDQTAGNRLLSPVVRRLVNEHGLSPEQITGTGLGGRITREDVLDHIDRLAAGVRAAAPAAAAPAAAAPAPAPAPSPSPAPAPAVPRGPRTSTIKLSKIRKLTGDHMVMSKATSPHAFSVVEVDFANVDRARRAVKDRWKEEEGFSLTYLPFISRAVVDSLGEFKNLNASVGDNELIVHDNVDLGIAVDMDYQGLLVPVVRDAGLKRLRALAREINDLAGRARSRKILPDEIAGGTFTITNNGSAGSVLTMAI
ncbi:MAG: dihydrolipoyllysine-residue succinyltransferase, partial [Actinobacteria bacterium]|nr:dihydrolipoyllysine-residue succinyltransferase [Actinomycetota bacterium]